MSIPFAYVTQDFGRSENGGGSTSKPHYYSPTQTFRPSAIPAHHFIRWYLIPLPPYFFRDYCSTVESSACGIDIPRPQNGCDPQRSTVSADLSLSLPDLGIIARPQGVGVIPRDANLWKSHNFSSGFRRLADQPHYHLNCPAQGPRGARPHLCMEQMMQINYF